MVFVKVGGTSELVGAVKAALASVGVVPVDERTQRLTQFTVELNDIETETVVFDSVDSEMERSLFSHVRALAGQVVTQDEGGNRETEKVVIGVPKSEKASVAVIQGLVRTFATAPDHVEALERLIAERIEAALKALPVKVLLAMLWRFVRLRLGFVMFALLLATAASAQTSEVTVVQGGNSAVVTAAGEIKVDCTAGCAAGSTGQQTMAASSPVVIASDQSTIAVQGCVLNGTAASCLDPVDITPDAAALFASVPSVVTPTTTSLTALNIAVTQTGDTRVGTFTLAIGTGLVGTVSFECEVNATGGFVAFPVATPSGAVVFSTATYPFTGVFAAGNGLLACRARVSAYTSGSASATIRPILAPSSAVTATLVNTALPLPTGAALDSSLTTLDADVKANVTLHAGTAVIGHVIADTGSTTAVTGNVATTVADAANVTFGAKADAKSTATDTTAVTAMQVLKEISAMEQAPAALPANQSVNVNQFGGSAVVTGTGASGSGVPRVTVANDSTVKVDQTQSSTAFSLSGTQSTTVTATGYASVIVQFTLVTGPGATTFSGSTDGVNYSAISLCPIVTANFCSTSAGVGFAVANIQGLTNFRITTSGLGNSSAGTIVLVPLGTYNTGMVAVQSMPSNSSVNISQMNGVATTMGNGISGTGVQRVTIASDSTGQIAGPTLTKGTQGATGFSVQSLIDSGRTRVSFTADRVTPAASDTLVTFVKNVAGTATTGQTTYTVTNAKTFRVTSIYVGLANTSTVSANVRVALRENTGGTCTASSAAVAMLQVAAGAIAANEGADGSMAIPDGWEFPAADSICFSAIGAATTETLTVSVVGFEY